MVDPVGGKGQSYPIEPNKDGNLDPNKQKARELLQDINKVEHDPNLSPEQKTTIMNKLLHRMQELVNSNPSSFSANFKSTLSELETLPDKGGNLAQVNIYIARLGKELNA